MHLLFPPRVERVLFGLLRTELIVVSLYSWASVSDTITPITFFYD